MVVERWRQVEQVLQAALDCAPGERAAFLDSVCAGDDDLRREAVTLITAYTEAGDFLEQPAIVCDADVLFARFPKIEIGKLVHRYRIVASLGAGGMSEVYLAEDVQLKRQIALKILPAHFVINTKRLELFKREAQAASMLNHPNILTIHEVGEADDLHFIATEYVDGVTLRELIARKLLTLTEILDAAIQIASALAAAHQAGIIHRDIKPENIMRRNDGIVKVLDFGIAKLIAPTPREVADYIADDDAATQVLTSDFTTLNPPTDAGVIANDIIGTVAYMSPEQARGLGIDARTDIWSFGIVLYEMIAGRTPFRGLTHAETLAQITERAPDALDFSNTDTPASLIKDLARTINKTLHKDARERYESAAELLANLKAVKRDYELADVTASDTQPPLTKRLRFKLAALIASILAVTSAAFLYQDFIAQRFNRSLLSLSSNADLSTASSQVVTEIHYRQMNETEKLLFVEAQALRISQLLGERPVKLAPDALQAIKRQVDRYAARIGGTSREPGSEDLSVTYRRALAHLPLIKRTFAAHKVPVIIGVYLPMIESEYRPCFENPIGAKGMFQFMPKTAAHYGVSHNEMCDMEKMTPAAARFIADRMAELGSDSASMTLVLLSYNRGDNGVRQMLRELRTAPNYERNFWTLYANRARLDDNFRHENAQYVPLFFAAAIVGENPHNFELNTPPLSTIDDTAK